MQRVAIFPSCACPVFYKDNCRVRIISVPGRRTRAGIQGNSQIGTCCRHLQHNSHWEACKAPWAGLRKQTTEYVVFYRVMFKTNMSREEKKLEVQEVFLVSLLLWVCVCGLLPQQGSPSPECPSWSPVGGCRAPRECCPCQVQWSHVMSRSPLKENNLSFHRFHALRLRAELRE